MTSQNAVFTENWLFCKSEVNTSYIIHMYHNCMREIKHNHESPTCVSMSPCHMYSTLLRSQRVHRIIEQLLKFLANSSIQELLQSILKDLDNIVVKWAVCDKVL